MVSSVRMRTWPAALCLALTAALLAGAPAAPPSQAATSVAAPDPAPERTYPVTRLRGADRFATAAAVSAATFDPGVAKVYVATGQVFADALAGGAVAGRDGAPILLVTRDGVPQATAGELDRLRPDAIVVLGGAAAVSDAVLEALRRHTTGTVTRLGGPSRYATAAAISAASFGPQTGTVLVATGEAFPDGLAGGALGGRLGVPVLLTARDALPQETAAELDRLGPASITVLGGSAAVSDGVLATLQRHTAGPVVRLAGDSRFATAATISQETLEPGVATVFLATGQAFPDALTGGPAAAVAGTSLLLTPTGCMPGVVRQEIHRLRPQRVVVLGGPSAVSDAAAALQGCEPHPPPTFQVDPSLAPRIPALPAWTQGGPPRALSSLSDGTTQVDFVADELLLMTDDPAQLAAFLQRWGGEVLHTNRARADAGLDMPDTYIVRVDPMRGDASGLQADLLALDRRARGAHTVADEKGLRLLAAAAADAADGLLVGLNPVFEPHGFADRVVEEAKSAPGIDGYDPNPMNWPHMRSGGAQDIGVADAWRMLELAGKLGGDPVDIAILDGGFIVASSDYPSSRAEFSVIPGQPSSGTPNLGQPSKAWHGTNVSMVAAGKINNHFGTAGTGHPVAHLITVNTTGDAGMGLLAISTAVVAGADIINMSYGIGWPASVSFLGAGFSLATQAAHAKGVLVISSAGNEGQDIDAEDCFFACWEETFWSPCENGDVFCVGGLAAGSRSRHPGSNYGVEWCGHADCDVNMYGPYVVYLGHDADNSGTTARIGNGTSYAAPFVAGVAALVWAADRNGMSNTAVQSLLRSTAHSSGDWTVDRYVNARAAVRAALGGTIPPYAEITEPVHHVTTPYGAFNHVSFSAVGDDYDGPCCSWRWTSSIDGVLTHAQSFEHVFDSPGTRTITLEATDSGGQKATRSVTVTATNQPPTPSIELPTHGSSLPRGPTIKLQGSVGDPNDFSAPCSYLEWTSSAAADQKANGGSFPTAGCQPDVVFPTNGSRALTLRATDPHGATSTRTVSITVVDPPASPVGTITSPDEGAALQPSQPVDLLSDTFEPDGDPITHEWRVVDGGKSTTIGSTEDVQGWVPSSAVPFNCGGRTVVLAKHTTDKDGTHVSERTVYVAHPAC